MLKKEKKHSAFHLIAETDKYRCICICTCINSGKGGNNCLLVRPGEYTNAHPRTHTRVGSYRVHKYIFTDRACHIRNLNLLKPQKKNVVN